MGLVLGAVATQCWLYYDRTKAPDAFARYKLSARERVSSTASIFYLEPQEVSTKYDIYKETWREGVWNVHFKQPQIQVVRAYTPLPPPVDELGANGRGATPALRFLIRRDTHGEVSSYLHGLPIGAEIELRGPNIEYRLAPSTKQIVFFAGGTGIAPALQIAHAMFDAQRNSEVDSDGNRAGKKLHILWATRKREDCAGGVSDADLADHAGTHSIWARFFGKEKSSPPQDMADESKGPIVRELDALKQKYPDQITVDYFVDEEKSSIDLATVSRALSAFDCEPSTESHGAAQQGGVQILISGPPGFVNHLAGPKEWRNGREEQGAIGNVIAQASSKYPRLVNVWKV